MAANGESLSDWNHFFESILTLLNEYELHFNTEDPCLQENISIRMESSVVALQQVISSPSTDSLGCRPFLECLLRNIRILIIDWNRANGNVSQCTRVAVYQFEKPVVISTAKPWQT